MVSLHEVCVRWLCPASLTYARQGVKIGQVAEGIRRQGRESWAFAGIHGQRNGSREHSQPSEGLCYTQDR